MVLGTWRNDMSRFSGTAHSSSGDRCQNHGNCGTGIVGRLVRNEPERPVWGGRDTEGTPRQTRWQ